MKHYITLIILFFSNNCLAQELDIFQKDFIYQKNSISTRIMYCTNGDKLQKEIVTNYDTKGRLTKRFWFWNGESNFHNVETFYYLDSYLLSRIINSFADSTEETTRFFYENSVLKSSLTVDLNKDTIDYHNYSTRNQVIKTWYMNGKPYRYDTTIYEKPNAKMEYYGIDYSSNNPKYLRWHYRFKNHFDISENLIRTEFKSKLPTTNFTKYVYDKRDLLIKKEEVILSQKQERALRTYYFIYE
jgi:hypothetical protein